ncbi:uncharacterized protein ColSpa_04078 [Colletotrichum spaethianum]|uniref:Uncharacterized protein n=1 Tax=Colletotrichum spaethianum TaxID=700344 RepID=A0AA37NW37_9PEZI|nr:uncharacterized protein ColSpa_04078 [Colletotrichum spaethianum]GKT43897.1 hypothetical protein ColSpa_04078 [Colletotrichum spaethianum]
MPRIVCNPDAPSGPWTAKTPCLVCYEARKVRERPSILRRLLCSTRRPDPMFLPSVCSECGSAGSVTFTFSEPNWNPEHRADRRVEESVGPTNETRADDVFGPPTPMGKPARMWARFKPLENYPQFAAPDAHDLAWAKAIRKAQKPERSVSGLLKRLRSMAAPLMPPRGPTPLPLTYEERRRRSQERWRLAKKLRRTRNGAKNRSTSNVTLPRSILESIPEEEEPEEESRTLVRHQLKGG